MLGGCLERKGKRAAGQEALAEALPPLTRHEALVESTRCLMCYDAPCTPPALHIDIPKFIKKISTDNLLGSAHDSEANLWEHPARLPGSELCEGACVLGAEHKPIAIGLFQRYAMDHVTAGVDIF
jgi:glutamate synthase (NADPH/NADH) small chain